MTQRKNPLNRGRGNPQQNAYARPEGQRHPAWMEEEDPWAAQVQPWEEEIPYEEAPYEAPGYDEPFYDEPAWEQAAYHPPRQTRPLREEVIATNRMVLLTCTLASMMGLFALFLCFEEKKSRAIRWFSVQSAGLMAAHAAAAIVLLVTGAVLGAVPFLGFLVTLICWLVYLAVLVSVVFMRVRMMRCAWRGVRFTLPVIGQQLARFC